MQQQQSATSMVLVRLSESIPLLSEATPGRTEASSTDATTETVTARAVEKPPAKNPGKRTPKKSTQRKAGKPLPTRFGSALLSPRTCRPDNVCLTFRCRASRSSRISTLSRKPVGLRVGVEDAGLLWGTIVPLAPCSLVARLDNRRGRRHSVAAAQRTVDVLAVAP